MDGPDGDFRRALIAGVGLIGASFALALRRAGFRGAVVGFDPFASRDDLHAVESAFDALCVRPIGAADVQPSDLVVLAAPVGAALETLRSFPPSLPVGTVVTDVGSTKRAICAVAARLGDRFVGGHPMAGAECGGARSARADLFDGATYFLVGSGDALARVRAAVASLGAVPVETSAVEHDRGVALASHVPQLVSSALAATVAARGAGRFGGPGLAGMTRLASSPWSVWRDVLATNADALLDPLDELIAGLAAARDALASGDEGPLRDLFPEEPAR